MKFNNRVAVITGGAGRIGKATAELFLEQGVSVALADINPEKLAEAVESLRAKGGTVRPYLVNVRSMESVTAFAAQVLADFGKIDILVNNAGVWKPAMMTEMTCELWEEMIDLNLNGVFRVTKAFLPALLQNGYGRIINLTSIAGEVGLPNYSAYAASKGGVMLYSKTLAMELAKKNITVNCVSPGMIVDAVTETKGTWLERTGLGMDVARNILFLASDNASFITGVDHTVDGGRILGPRFSDV